MAILTSEGSKAPPGQGTEQRGRGLLHRGTNLLMLGGVPEGAAVVVTYWRISVLFSSRVYCLLRCRCLNALTHLETLAVLGCCRDYRWNYWLPKRCS